LIQSTNYAVAIIYVISKELHNTILKDDISDREPPISFFTRTNGICKNWITLKSSFKYFCRRFKSTIADMSAINLNTKLYSTKIFMIWKKFKYSSCFFSIRNSKNYFWTTLSTIINIKSDHRVGVKKGF